MKATLTFEPTDVGKELYQYLSDGLLLGASDGKPKSKDETRKLASIQRSVWKIGVPVPIDQLDPRLRPIGARDLKPEGGSLVFEQGDIEKMTKLVEAVAWGGSQQIPVADLYDFLSKAPVVEEASQA